MRRIFQACGNLHHPVNICRGHAANAGGLGQGIHLCWLRQSRRRSPHPSGADNGRPAAPDRQTPQPPRAARRAGAHQRRSALPFAPIQPPDTPTPAAERRLRRREQPATASERVPPAHALRPAVLSTAHPPEPAADRPHGDARQALPSGSQPWSASTSKRETATTGIRAASASPFTAARPTRTPVKLPGPLIGHDCTQLAQRNAAQRQHLAHGRNQRGRIVAPLQLDLAENLDSLPVPAPQRHRAGRSAGVDGQK